MTAKKINYAWRTPESIKPWTITTFEQSRTDQSLKSACDINNIVKQITMQQLQLLNMKSELQYTDVTNIPDLPTAMQTVIDAQDQFSELPVEMKQAISNDWTRVGELFEGDKHLALLEKYGFIDQSQTSKGEPKQGSEATPPPTPPDNVSV